MKMTIRPLTEHTGAEVIGLDLREPLTADIKKQLFDLFCDRGVLVFRNQSLRAEEFLEIGPIFGEVMPQQVKRFTVDDNSMIGFVSSEDTDKPGADGKRLVRGEQYHTDHSNMPVPPRATALCAVTLPNVGGDTQFVNVMDSYQDLPSEMKDRIRGLRVLHTYMSTRSPRKKPQLPPEELARLPQTAQPLVIEHPVTKRPALYLNTAHMERTIDMDPDEGFKIIDALMVHATQPKYEYRHKWQKGDVVIWDNQGVMHQANGDYAPEQKRYLYRIMIKGQQPLQAAQ